MTLHIHIPLVVSQMMVVMSPFIFTPFILHMNLKGVTNMLWGGYD